MEDRKQMTEIRKSIKSFRDLKVYTEAHRLALEVFTVSKKFPKEENYSMIDQIRRSSRSISANIREGFAKRKYPNVFIRHLTDAIGSCEETREWLDFAFEFSYIQKSTHELLDRQYDQVSAMLYTLINRWISY